MKDDLRLPFPDSTPDVRIATGRRELTGAFELVYRSYLAKGYIQPHPGRIVYHATFGLPSSRTIIATAEAEGMVGTLTVAGDNPLGLQLETTYPGEVQSLREHGRNVAEITCLAIQSTGKFQPGAVFFLITRFMIHYAYWRRYDDLLIAIHPRHQRFYRRCFGVDPLGPCRPHELVGGNPSVCCRIDLHHLRRNANPELWQQYFAQDLPQTPYMMPPTDPADHRYFCSRREIADLSGYRLWDQDAA